MNYRYVGEYVNVEACKRDQTERIYTEKKWSLIRELPLGEAINLTLEDLEEQSSRSRFMQMKAAELIGNIGRAGSNSQAPYMQLFGKTDELARARYAKFIDKRSSGLGEDGLEKILEDSRRLGVGWKLEELKDKLTTTLRKKSSVYAGEPAKCFNVSTELTDISEAPNTMNRF